MTVSFWGVFLFSFGRMAAIFALLSYEPGAGLEAATGGRGADSVPQPALLLEPE